MAAYYIAKTSDYWLRVKMSDGEIQSVPYGLKVQRLDSKNGREYFQILEGVHNGKTASVSIQQGHSYLTTEITHRRGGVLLKFDRKSQTLYLNSAGPFNAFSGGGHMGFTPVSEGTYPLAIPAFPSAQTRREYEKWTKYHRIWFRIGTDVSGSRFLHAGAISDGCVTVRQFVYNSATGEVPPVGFDDLSKLAKTAPGLIGLPLPSKVAPTIGWDEIVDALILSRISDEAVALLVVM
jgi:hypothetical protein